jgi:hypothetical protein
MDSIDYFLKVNKEDIYLICPYFEAFEGMAAIPIATLKLMVSPDFKEDFEKLISHIKERLNLEILENAEAE